MGGEDLDVTSQILRPWAITIDTLDNALSNRRRKNLTQQVFRDIEDLGRCRRGPLRHSVFIEMEPQRDFLNSFGGGCSVTAKPSRTKLAAVVHADIRGYSRLMESDENWTIATLTSCREELKRLVEGHHGQIVDTAGDGFLLEFGSAKDAVKFAVEFQDVVTTRNTSLAEDRRMEFRIGINLGDVIEVDGKIYGDAINIAARLEGLAEPGGICISGTVYETVRKGLNLEYEFLGEQSVKNIAEPVPAYRIHLGSSMSVSESSTASELPVGENWPRTDIPLPTTRKEFSDRDRASFLREAFNEIISYFQRGLGLLEKSAPGIQAEAMEITKQKYVFELYRGGELKNSCKIWIGSLGTQKNVSYYEGNFAPHDDSSVNEWIHVESDDREMYLQGIMGEFGNRQHDRLSVEEAARGLWERFIRPLSY